MNSSLIRSGAAAVVAALAFAACGGSNGMVPASSGMPSTTGNALQMTSDAASPYCPIPVGYPFGGSCNPIKLKKTGSAGNLKAYKGFTLTSQLSSNTSKKGTILAFQDATGKGDIGKYKGKSLPKDKNAILYLAGLNTGAAFSFNATPAITIKSTTAINGKSCSLDQFEKNGKWKATGITGTVKGKTVAFGSLPVSKAIPNGVFYLAFSCK
jgi:hypothetical protein